MSLARRQHGLSMVELMVALAVSLFLVLGVIQVYLGNKQTYRLTDSMSRVQENGRFAMETLARDLRMADFWGCAGYANVSKNDLDTTNAGYDPNIHNFSGTNDGLRGTDNTGLNGSDTLTLRGAIPGGVNVEAPAAPTTSSSLKVTAGDHGLQIGDIIMVSDCSGADIFQITNLQTSGSKHNVVHNSGSTGVVPGNASGDLSKTYLGNASIYKMRVVTYSVAAGPSGEPALYVNDNGQSYALVEGVENMQILYGEDVNNDSVADRYVAYGSVGDIENVVSVRIELLVRAPETGVLDEAQTLTYNGTSTTYSDRRLRQVFSSTITIRNRAL